jgi:ParB family chromosome partitioning protein
LTSGTSGGSARIANQSEVTPFEAAGLTLMELPIDQIAPNAAQPRQHFDEEALTELVHSITEIGLLQPIVVRPAEVGYELIAGERRLRASKLAGLKTIPALVRQTADEQMLRDALLENLHRSQLTALEEAAAYHQLLEDFGCTQEELATRLGRSRPQISNTLRLLNLPASVQRRVAAGVLSAGHARALLGLKDAAAIEKLAARIVAEGLSVRSVEEIVSVGLADKPKSGKTAKAKGVISAPGLAELGERMSARLDTRVTLSVGQKRGKVTIEFATLEDLRRIVEIVDPPTRGMFGEPLL